MTEPARRRVLIVGLIAVAACVFLTGINWGLPSRAIDKYLFGDEPVWSGEKILSLAPSDANQLGADVDVNPLAKKNYPIVLNDTDEKRAEIIRRYRLFSHQPDEMITFKSLSRINQYRGDPRLYQYGGLWMYPVGVMLKVASIVGLVELKGGPAGQAYYLDHPEAFGRFYVVARFYTVLWGLIGVWAVFWIVHRLTNSDFAAAVGALCYTFMPVVVNMAHEAKPHLPGAVLMLLSIIAATKYVETGRTRWWVITGALCGAAFGMVLSSLVGFVVIPVMVLLREESWKQRIKVVLGATAVGFVIYFVTNPYVLINSIFAPEILRSNLSNSTAMYGKRGLGGLLNALRLLVMATSPVVLGMGIFGVFGVRKRDGHVHPLVWLLIAPAALVLVQFALLAEGKPAEYARFALLPAVALAILTTGVGVHLLRFRAARIIYAVAVVALTAVWGVPYVLAFRADIGPNNSRLLTAEGMIVEEGDLPLVAEPAPYSCPPVNVFKRRLLLVDPLSKPRGTLMVDEGNGRFSDTPISWANKLFVEGDEHH